jgi:hypothetical protein
MSSTIKGVYAETVTEMHDALCRQLLYGTPLTLDDYNSVDVQMHNVVAEAKSFVWDKYIDEQWVPHTRWNRMVRQYIDPDLLIEWLDLIENRFPGYKRGIAVMRTNTVQSRVTGRGTIRRWGSCMLSISYRLKPWPQITLHSRTCYLGYLSILDVSVAYVCAQLAAMRTGVDVSKVRFVWQLEAAQWHGYRSLAWVLNDEDRANAFANFEYTRESHPGIYISRKWLADIDRLDEQHVLYGDQKFTSYARIRKRYHAQVFGEEYAQQFAGGEKRSNIFKTLSHVHVDSLDFKAIGIDKEGNKI